ncbi:hypothetical protein RDI58_002734 [Solanum bulbocastanum]|uniref:Uncharacterized protein n=1 Tax=Solanum bulbocastanum TaxID=147425 RepID=A0AAN8UE09_SOLBU
MEDIWLDLIDRTNNCYWKKVGYLIPGNSTCLGGNISFDLLDLHHLEYLTLVYPSFRVCSYPFDTVERSWVKDLNWISGLSSLKCLDLSYVNLSSATHWLDSINKLPSLVTLSLQNCSLHYLPYSFPNWNMTSLSYLSLSHNNFVNSELPKWLSNDTTIETLYMVYSNIQGPISNVEWGKLCNLQKLYLEQNKLNGDISRVVEELSKCSNPTIEVLSLGENVLTGKLPNSLGHLKNFRILSISFNMISGTVLASIEQLSRLEILYFGENQLKRPLPESIFNLSELTALQLTTNALEGNQSFTKSLCKTPSTESFIPILWKKFFNQLEQYNQIGGSLPRIVNFPSTYQIWTVGFYFSYYYGVMVDLSSNHFHGSLPLWPTMTDLNLANNWFSGCIPLNIGHVMTKLQVLDLSGNDFIGTIPYSITSVKQLLRLDLSDNHLSGKIPDWWYDLQQLQVIDLSGNNLSGTIPPSVCSPLSLFWLRLCRNNFSRGLPKSLRNCNSLLTLDIAENKITGTIPKWFGESLLSLHKLRMTSNMIHGRIPPQLCQLSNNHQILHLSHNNLTGSIPSCLGTLSGLKLVKFYKWFPNYLYFSYVFTPKMELIEKGTKDTYTFTLGQVNLIDISCNNLQGEIPNEITALPALSTLNLSRNQLS